MQVLMHNRHTPHAWMTACALPEVKFIVPDWNGMLRPQPPNVTIVPVPACFDLTYDAVIDDDKAMPMFQALARKKIWMQHCESSLDDRAQLENIAERSDLIVVVCTHKRVTMCEVGLLPKCHIIGFGFDLNHWPLATGGGGVGTVGNSLNDITQVRDTCDYFGGLMPFTIIGHNSDRSAKCRNVAPPTFDAYRQRLGELDVYVICIIGQTMGMAPIEAMAMGIPVVMGQYPEVADFALGNWNCVLSLDSPASSLEFLAARTKELLEDKAFAQKISVNARKTVGAYFSLADVGDRWRRLL